MGDRRKKKGEIMRKKKTQILNQQGRREKKNNKRRRLQWLGKTKREEYRFQNKEFFKKVLGKKYK